MRKAVNNAVVYMTILALVVVVAPMGANAAVANSTIGSRWCDATCRGAKTARRRSCSATICCEIWP